MRRGRRLSLEFRELRLGSFFFVDDVMINICRILLLALLRLIINRLLIVEIIGVGLISLRNPVVPLPLIQIVNNVHHSLMGTRILAT